MTKGKAWTHVNLQCSRASSLSLQLLRRSFMELSIEDRKLDKLGLRASELPGETLRHSLLDAAQCGWLETRSRRVARIASAVVMHKSCGNNFKRLR